jgi:polyisoprenoid-binding protein YceI
MGMNPARSWAAHSRRHARVFVVFALLGLAGPAAAESALQSVKGRCEIQFFGSSTFHGFSGEVRSRPFQLEPQLDMPSGRARWSGAVEIEVAEMNTGIERRDRKMREMFDADRFPRIVANFSNVGDAALANARSGGEFDLGFDLTIREAKRPVTAKASHWIEQGRGASFDVAFELSLEAFGLEVPPVLGLLRVGDAVTVHAHVTLDAPPGPPRDPAPLDPLPGSPASGS